MGESMAWDAIESGIDNGDGTGAYCSPTWGMDYEWEISLYHLRKDLQRRFRKYGLRVVSYDPEVGELVITLSKAGGGDSRITVFDASHKGEDYTIGYRINGTSTWGKDIESAMVMLRSPMYRTIIKTAADAMF